MTRSTDFSTDLQYSQGWCLRDGDFPGEIPSKAGLFLGTIFLARRKAESGRPEGGVGHASCSTAHLSAVISWGGGRRRLPLHKHITHLPRFSLWTETMFPLNPKSPPPPHPWPLASTNVKFQFIFTLWVGRTLHKYLKYKFLVFLCQNKDIWTVS